jgi:hypothetical protein
VRVAYSRNEQSLRQYIGAWINNHVVTAFLIVPTSRSFWLFGHFSFLAVPAVRSVWQFSVIPVTDTKRNKEGEAHQTVHCVLPIAKENAYNFVVLITVVLK